MTKDIVTRLERVIKEFDFTNFSFTPLQSPKTFPYYQNWLDQALNASMEYLQRHAKAKANPHSYKPWAKSIIVIAKNYIPHPSPSDGDMSFTELKIAKYAKGKDYHQWFHRDLQDLCERLTLLFPNDIFSAHTDTAPILERNWAQESGMGWFGKNTCIINKDYGSFHLLGEILTSLPLPLPDTVHPDLCGKCTRCIDACPTQALENKLLNANKCISYWTIETRKTPPLELRNKFENWIFGCDICQDVCPWNHKAFQTEKIKNNIDLDKLEAELQWLLNQSHNSLAKLFKNTPFSRTGPLGLKKNAILAVGTHKLSKLKPLLEKYSTHTTLGEVSRWALEQIKNSDNMSL